MLVCRALFASSFRQLGSLLAIDWRDKHEKDVQLFLGQVIAYEQSLTEQLEKDKVNT